MLERAASLGGTWRDNTYPGIACDVPAHLYGFATHPNPAWSGTYARGAEIHAYLQDVAAAEGLGDRLRLRTPMHRAQWDADRRVWRLTVGSPARPGDRAPRRVSSSRDPDHRAFSVKAFLFLILLSASAWSGGCRREVPIAAKAARAQRKAPAEPELQRLKEIERIGPTAAKDRAARVNLGRALHDPRRPVRDQAAHWLSKAGAEAVPILVTALESPDTQVAVTAAYALGLMGETAAPAVPALTQQLGGPIDTLANMSDWALSQVGPRGKGGIVPLLRDLRYGNPYERAAAARG